MFWFFLLLSGVTGSLVSESDYSTLDCSDNYVLAYYYPEGVCLQLLTNFSLVYSCTGSQFTASSYQNDNCASAGLLANLNGSTGTCQGGSKVICDTSSAPSSYTSTIYYSDRYCQVPVSSESYLTPNCYDGVTTSCNSTTVITNTWDDVNCNTTILFSSTAPVGCQEGAADSTAVTCGNFTGAFINYTAPIQPAYAAETDFYDPSCAFGANAQRSHLVTPGTCTEGILLTCSSNGTWVRQTWADEFCSSTILNQTTGESGVCYHFSPSYPWQSFVIVCDNSTLLAPHPKANTFVVSIFDFFCESSPTEIDSGPTSTCFPDNDNTSTIYTCAMYEGAYSLVQSNFASPDCTGSVSVDGSTTDQCEFGYLATCYGDDAATPVNATTTSFVSSTCQSYVGSQATSLRFTGTCDDGVILLCYSNGTYLYQDWTDPYCATHINNQFVGQSGVCHTSSTSPWQSVLINCNDNTLPLPPKTANTFVVTTGDEYGDCDAQTEVFSGPTGQCIPSPSGNGSAIVTCAVTNSEAEIVAIEFATLNCSGPSTVSVTATDSCNFDGSLSSCYGSGTTAVMTQYNDPSCRLGVNFQASAIGEVGTCIDSVTLVCYPNGSYVYSTWSDFYCTSNVSSRVEGQSGSCTHYYSGSSLGLVVTCNSATFPVAPTTGAYWSLADYNEYTCDTQAELDVGIPNICFPIEANASAYVTCTSNAIFIAVFNESKNCLGNNESESLPLHECWYGTYATCSNGVSASSSSTHSASSTGHSASSTGYSAGSTGYSASSTGYSASSTGGSSSKSSTTSTSTGGTYINSASAFGVDVFVSGLILALGMLFLS